MPIEVGEPSPQSMTAVKSAIVDVGLASVKEPATVELGNATPVFGREGTRGARGQRGVGDHRDRGALRP